MNEHRGSGFTLEQTQPYYLYVLNLEGVESPVVAITELCIDLNETWYHINTIRKGWLTKHQTSTLNRTGQTLALLRGIWVPYSEEISINTVGSSERKTLRVTQVVIKPFYGITDDEYQLSGESRDKLTERLAKEGKVMKPAYPHTLITLKPWKKKT